MRWSGSERMKAAADFVGDAETGGKSGDVGGKTVIDAEHFNHLNYIKKEPLTGSMNGMRYMLKKRTEGEESYMEGIVWPEPLGYAKTPEDQKTRERFTLDAEGMAAAVDWLNEMYRNSTWQK